MVKRATTEARWTVFSLVVDYLPERSRARLSTVSKDANELIPTIPVPSYAAIIEDFSRASKNPEITYIESVTEMNGHTVILTCENYYDKMEFRIYHEALELTWLVTRCNGFRLKSMIYRSIEQKKEKIMRGQKVKIEDIFQNLSIPLHHYTFYTLID